MVMESDEHIEDDYGWPEDDAWPEHDGNELFSVGANIDDNYGTQEVSGPHPDDILQDTEFPQDTNVASPDQLWQWTREEPSFQDLLGRAANGHGHDFNQTQEQYNLGASDFDYVNSVSDSFQDVQQPHPSQTGRTASTQQSSSSDDTVSLTTHSTEATAGNGGPFRCTEDGCSSRLKNEEGLERHRQRCHQHPKVPCSICGQLYSPSGHMEKHLRTHKGRAEWKFPCDLCGKLFKRDDHMKRHRNNKKCVKAQWARRLIASSPCPAPESSAMAARRLQQRTRATLLPADRTVPAPQGSGSSTNSRVEASTSASGSGTGRPRTTPTTHPSPLYFVPPPGLGPFVLPPDPEPSLLPPSWVLCVLPSGLGLLVPASSLLDPGIVSYLLNEQARVVLAPSMATLPPPLSRSVQPHALNATLANRTHHPRLPAGSFTPDQQLERLDPRLRPPTQTDSAGGSSVSSTRPRLARVQSEQPPSGQPAREQPLPEHLDAVAFHEEDAASPHDTANFSNNQTGSSGRPWKGKGKQR